GGTTTLTFGASAVDAGSDDKTDKDTITVNGAEGLQTGDAVKYSKGAGDAIGGLDDGKTYYAIVQDDGSLKLADTKAHATAGTAIDLTSKGTGDQTLEFDWLHTP